MVQIVRKNILCSKNNCNTNKNPPKKYFKGANIFIENMINPYWNCLSQRRDAPTLKISYFSLWLAFSQWKTLLVEKTLILEVGESQPSRVYLLIRKWSKNFLHHCQMFLVIMRLEESETKVKLKHDATNTPHVTRLGPTELC